MTRQGRPSVWSEVGHLSAVRMMLSTFQTISGRNQLVGMFGPVRRSRAQCRSVSASGQKVRTSYRLDNTHFDTQQTVGESSNQQTNSQRPLLRAATFALTQHGLVIQDLSCASLCSPSMYNLPKIMTITSSYSLDQMRSLS